MKAMKQSNALFEFSLSVFTKFAKLSCVRDQDVTTEPARHSEQTGSLD